MNKIDMRNMLKKSLKIPTFYNDDDDLIDGYITAATQQVKKAIGDDFDTVEISDIDDDGNIQTVPIKFYNREEVTDVIKIPIIATAGTLYKYRINVSTSKTYDVSSTSMTYIQTLRGMYAQLKTEADNVKKANSK